MHRHGTTVGVVAFPPIALDGPEVVKAKDSIGVPAVDERALRGDKRVGALWKKKNKKEGTRVRKHERVHVRYVGGAPAEQHLLFEL